jgi:hypothetical protein
VRDFVLGALTMSSAVAAIFFLRYWHLSRDRLYIYFCIAFTVMGLNWLGLVLIGINDEATHRLYLLRLLAFVLIIIGIVDKNQRGHGP